MQYHWDFSVLWEHRLALARGVQASVGLTLCCIVVGLLLGTAAAVGLVQRRFRLLRWGLLGVVEILRALPLLVLLVWLYYLLPALTGLELSAFNTAALGLSINLAAFVAEVLRASIEGVPRPQIEAGQALGMSSGQVLRLVILPEAFRQALPALVALFITMFKMSTLASVIAVWELLHAANTVIATSYKALEVYTGIALIYLAILLPATWGLRRLERSRWFLRRS